MFASSPNGDHHREPLLRRLDRAASTMNPMLAVCALGLVILNLVCVFTLAATGRVATYANPAVARCLNGEQQAIGWRLETAPDSHP